MRLQQVYLPQHRDESTVNELSLERVIELYISGKDGLSLYLSQ